jgi:transposase InsO family protein
VATPYIEPGASWQDAYAESFHGKLRDEPLDAEMFTDPREAQALAANWKNHYNHRRPHSSLGSRTPAEYAATFRGGGR